MDRTLLSNLTPSKTATLNYAQLDPGNCAVSLVFDMLYHQVTLEDSSHVAEVACTDSSVTITLAGQDSFSIAQGWPQTDFVIVTNSQGCNPGNERGVYLVRGSVVSPNKLAVTLQVEAQTWKDVAVEMQINYGTVVQNSSSTSVPYTFACTSAYPHPVSSLHSALSTVALTSSSSTSASTTSAPTASPTLVVGEKAFELYQFLLNNAKRDEDGNIVAQLPVVPKQTIEVPEQDPFNGDPALQAQLDDVLAAKGLSRPQDLFDQAKDGLSQGAAASCGAPPSPTVSSKRSIDDILRLNARDDEQPDGWDIACDDLIKTFTGDLGELVCAGKDI